MEKVDTLDELISELDAIRDEVGGDAKVRTHSRVTVTPEVNETGLETWVEL